MRKLTLLLTALAAVLLLAACESKDVKDYTFAFDYQAELANEEDAIALEDYFNHHFMDEDHILTIHATYYEAHELARGLWDTVGPTEDDGRFLLNLIREEDDYIYLRSVLIQGESAETVNETYWNLELKKVLGLL